MYPSLPKSYKNQFPFRIGTTSFIYPDYYAQNARMLGPFLDEIELLFFESNMENSLPSKAEILELKNLAEELCFTYNIHLPVDISLGDPNPAAQMHAVDILKRFFQRTQPLAASTNTLHLVQPEKMDTSSKISKWQDSIGQSLEKILEKDVDGKSISIENLFYPIDLVENIIKKFNLRVCLDLGHLILSTQDIEKTIAKWIGKTTIVHLHGVEAGKDHLSLDCMPLEQMNKIIKQLCGFTGTVSIEVFSYQQLQSSLETFENQWRIANDL